MIIVEPPRIRKVVPSLRDMENIEDAVWRPVPRWKLYLRDIKKRLTGAKSRGKMPPMMNEGDKMHKPSKLTAWDIAGGTMMMVFIISLLFL